MRAPAGRRISAGVCRVGSGVRLLLTELPHGIPVGHGTAAQIGVNGER